MSNRRHWVIGLLGYWDIGRETNHPITQCLFLEHIALDVLLPDFRPVNDPLRIDRDALGGAGIPGLANRVGDEVLDGPVFRAADADAAFPALMRVRAAAA